MAKQNPILEATNKALAKMGIGGGPNATSDDHAPVSTTIKSQRGNGDGSIAVSTKGSGYLGIDGEPVGSTLNPQAQLGLFAKIRKTSDWARFVSFKPVSERTGTLDVWTDESFKMHSTQTEGPRTNIPLAKPDLDQKTFTVQTLSGAFGLRLGALKAAARAGQDVNGLIQAGIAAGIGNVFLDIGINGDTSLPADSDQNKQRRTVNGWFTKIRANGSNYNGQADGFSYHNRIWPGMLQQIDDGYRSDKGLAWAGPDVLGTRWLTELTATQPSPSNSHPSIINDFGASLLNAMGNGARPLGKPMVIIPQQSSSRFGTEGYAGMAPTSLVNNGDGTLTININTLAGSGTDRSSTGTDGQRYVTVGRVSTGLEETIAIDYSAPNNTVTTASYLGQTAVSTTAADYYVKWADLTSLFLGVMRFLTMVVQNGIRIYTVFYPRDEVLEIIVHADIDYMVIDYDAMSLTDDIISPRFSVLPD
jgi:hypothetical protein